MFYLHTLSFPVNKLIPFKIKYKLIKVIVHLNKILLLTTVKGYFIYYIIFNLIFNTKVFSIYFIGLTLETFVFKTTTSLKVIKVYII